MVDICHPDFEDKVSAATLESPKIISSSALLGKQNQILIVHDGQLYQLRITKLRKLILTK
ncbi:hemin uptake protein HemP [Polynucleobacter sp. MWH-UH2A]|uniref:hemin uptake protein HemP n=1 Tax=Polynucleobacter sp. MWH-UH2A TaxID=1855617 RepID=UPI001BFD9314|nr:hemin uptake protein HemP [Polynucleobacter sp. MWH-UH2A]QWD64520.1 hemin uptake protein HemP [Polynucleobacter sp. MWH-UH2A]